MRDHHHCRKCDAYTCGTAECVAFCTPFDKVIDDFLEAGAKQLPFTPPPNK